MTSLDSLGTKVLGQTCFLLKFLIQHFFFYNQCQKSSLEVRTNSRKLKKETNIARNRIKKVVDSEERDRERLYGKLRI